jgi:hypothetical protein
MMYFKEKEDKEKDNQIVILAVKYGGARSGGVRVLIQT